MRFASPARYATQGVAIFGACLLIGCPASEQAAGPSAQATRDAEQLAPDCDVRDITEVPQHVYVSVGSDIDVTVDPPDSPLARLVLPHSLCPDPAPVVPSSDFSYEIGADGRVLRLCVGFPTGEYFCSTPSSASQFQVIDGCLVQVFEGIPAPDSFEGLDIDLDALRNAIGGVSSLCPHGEQVIYQNGSGVPRSADEPYGCYAVDRGASCTTCESSGGVWSQTLEIVMTISASATLLGVIAPASSCSAEEVVDIHAGDRVAVHTISRHYYQVVAPPSGEPLLP